MELKNFIDVDAFTTEVMEPLTDLTEAMSTQTARTAFYGIQHAAAKSQKANVDLIYSSVEAQLTKNYRTQMEDAARAEVDGTNKVPTRVTAEMVKSAVHLDPNFIKYSKVLIEACEIETVCRVAYDAFKTRREMLSSMGHLQSAQLRGNATVAGAVEAGNRHRERLNGRANQTPAS